ncbi:hypothetical protein EDD11_001549 [Mortierella claussenii]|nr:hypothetical protein EDD11_001549 [Mortierella claussenii]
MPNQTPAFASIPRQHTATLIQDTIYYVGGLGTASPNDSTPLHTFLAYDLKQLAFTEKKTSLAVYGHTATSNRTLDALTYPASARIGITFGLTGALSAADPLQWLDPNTGTVTPGEGLLSSAGTGGSNKGTSPLAGRVGHSLVQFGNTLWVSGGMSSSSLTPKGIPDSPMYDLSASFWYNKVKVLARYGHATAPAGRDAIVSCFGITSQSLLPAPQMIKDLDLSPCIYYTISTETYEPATLIYTNKSETPIGVRKGMSLVPDVTNPNTLYLFGGSDSTETKYYSDVYQFDVSSLPEIFVTKITQPAGSPPAGANAGYVPGPRSQHAAVSAGLQQGFMIIYGGLTSNNTMDNSSTPFFFSMKDKTWIDSKTFATIYVEQQHVSVNNVGLAVIIIGILAGVSVLGAGVFIYIHRGQKDDERKRIQKELEEAATAAEAGGAGSPSLSALDGYFKGRERKGTTERKGHAVYPMSGNGRREDHSMTTGPFKSTTSLIQDENVGKRTKKKNNNAGSQSGTDGYHSSRGRPWAGNDSSSTGGTLIENGSMNGYLSSSGSSSAPSRLNKNNSSGSSSQHSRQGPSTSVTTVMPSTVNVGGVPASGSGPEPGQGLTIEGGGISGGPLARDSYYNTHDLYVDDDENDDSSSVTASTLASESTTSPWSRPVNHMDLVLPNPRFSRGAISQAHLQLVGGINTSGTSYHHHRRNESSNWDTSSLGGSLSGSSRDGEGEHHRRSVNSMQWVSFDPSDLVGRPDSTYDPLGQRSLTVRNASLYVNNLNNTNNDNNRSSLIQSGNIAQFYVTNASTPRTSMYDGSNASEDSLSSYYFSSLANNSGNRSRVVSAVGAARQQRRSMRNSQDSQSSLPGRLAVAGGSSVPAVPAMSLSLTAAQESSSTAAENPLVTRVLPVISTKVMKPSMAKIVTHQRGSRSTMTPGSGPFGERGALSGALREEEEDGSHNSNNDNSGRESYMSGLGIDFSGFGMSNPIQTSFGNAMTYEPPPPPPRRGSSTLNPGYKRESRLSSSHTTNQQQQQQQQLQQQSEGKEAAPKVELRMPPPPQTNSTSTAAGVEVEGTRAQQPVSSGLRTSIMALGRDMPGFLDYGDNNHL